MASSSLVAKSKKRTRTSRKSREAEIVQEFEDYVESATNTALLGSHKDDDLFVVDRSGSKNKKRKIQKAEIEEQESGTISKTEKVLIERIRRNNNNSEERGETRTQYQRRAKKVSAKDVVFDLWGSNEKMSGNNNDDVGDNDSVVVRQQQQPRKTTRKEFKKIAGPGLSYNPAHDDHQEALAEAVALDIRHQEEIVRKEKAFDMDAYDSSIAKKINHNDGDEEAFSSSSSEDSADELGDGLGEAGLSAGLSRRERARRDNVKLSRAQRNKMRTKRILGHEKSIIERQNALEKDLAALPKHVKSIEAEEALRQAQKEFQVAQKAAKLEAERSALSAMNYADAGTVPLTDELHGSLRLIQPKGVSLADQSALMVAAGDLADRNRRNRQKHEKPHAGKKVVWIPKYKHNINESK